MTPEMQETVMSVCLGLGLAAACGFRVFVPLLGMNLAAQSGHLTLASGLEWMGSTPATICFASATLLEIGAYYIPWLDNALDSIATPAAVIAGTIATASVVTDMSPYLKWTLAAIAGGGAAAAVQTGTVAVRGVSTATTAGLGNFMVSSTEFLASIVGTILAIVLPILCAVLVVACLAILAAWYVRRRRRARGISPA